MYPFVQAAAKNYGEPFDPLFQMNLYTRIIIILITIKQLQIIKYTLR